jgi:hypothetical protein
MDSLLLLHRGGVLVEGWDFSVRIHTGFVSVYVQHTTQSTQNQMGLGAVICTEGVSKQAFSAPEIMFSCFLDPGSASRHPG